MLRHLLAAVLLTGSLFAAAVNLHSPQSAVISYYDAIHEGDLEALAQVMVPESYDTTVKVCALSIAMNDTAFMKVLNVYDQSDEAKKIVEDAVVKKLKSRKPRKISGLKVIPNGEDRAIVGYFEEEKPRHLYLSRYGDLWRVDYKAGRKVE